MRAIPGTPRPAGAPHDGQMVKAERDPRKDHPHGRTEDDVERVVSMVEPARGRDEECDSPGHKGKNDQIDGRRSALDLKRLTLPTVQILAEGRVGEVRERDGEFGAQPQGEVRQTSKGN